MSMAMAIILKVLFMRKKEGKVGKAAGKKEGRDVCQRQGKLELWGKQKSQELYFEVGWEVRPVLYACMMAVRHPSQVRGTEYFLLYL